MSSSLTCSSVVSIHRACASPGLDPQYWKKKKKMLDTLVTDVIAFLYKIISYYLLQDLFLCASFITEPRVSAMWGNRWCNRCLLCQAWWNRREGDICEFKAARATWWDPIPHPQKKCLLTSLSILLVLTSSKPCSCSYAWENLFKL